MHNNKLKVILLVSSGRSGSTILDLIMDSHPEIFGTGEIFQYEKAINFDIVCACGEKVKNCEFWQKVFKDVDFHNKLRAERNFFDCLLNNKKYKSKGHLINKNEYIALYEEIYNNISRFSGKRIIFDTSKEPDRAELLSQSKNIDFIFLHLVRDGRGVVWSYFKSHNKFFVYMLKWMKINLKIAIIKKRRKNIKKIYLNYNDFVENPKASLSKILEKVNCVYDDEMLNFRKHSHHEMAGNYMARFSKRNKVKADKEWRQKMPLLHKFVFNLFCGWLNIYYQKLK